MELPWMTIASHVIAIIIGIVGGYFGIFKSKLSGVRALLEVVEKAAADDKITTDEIVAIVEKAKELL